MNASSTDSARVIGVLNDLVETSKDGEYGFEQTAQHVKTPGLRETLAARSRECRRGADELQQCIRQLGGSPDTSGTVAGAMHRGWVSVRAALSTMDDLAMLEECERGEDTAIRRYRDALQEALPDEVRAIVQRQYEGVKRNHDEVKRLRDQARAGGGTAAATVGATTTTTVSGAGIDPATGAGIGTAGRRGGITGDDLA